MSAHYDYEMSGTATSGQQDWTVTGMVELINDRDFMFVGDKVLADAFRKLTKGEAVFGSPGVGCSGPYHIKKMTVEEKT
jgi:hypothetical protein